MITLLAQIFIKNRDNINQATTRNSYGVLCGALGIVLNLFLSTAKILAGLLSASIAVLADGVNNLTDAASSVITLIGFAISKRRPDEEHPFGHGRMEYVAGLFVSIVILLVGVELAKVSIGKIFEPSATEFDVIVIAILLISIVVKLYMALYNRAIGKKINSETLKTTAIDSLSHVVATTALLLSFLISHLTGILLDGWFGLLVAVFIVYSGIAAIINMIKILLGKNADPKLVERIYEIVLSSPEVLGVHDLMVHDYGAGNRIIMLHAEVSASSNMLEVHDTIDNIEKALTIELASEALIHMDPIDTDDDRTNEIRIQLTKKVTDIDRKASIHDLRVVSGPTHTNLIFDISVPYSTKLEESEIKEQVNTIVKNMNENYYMVLTIDRF